MLRGVIISRERERLFGGRRVLSLLEIRYSKLLERNKA